MASWNKKLQEWQGQGFINPGQAAQIQAYETAPGKRRSFGTWALIGFLMLGAVVIGLGILSLVAANWHRTPAWLKLATSFGFLIGTAGGACIAVQRGRTSFFEPLVVLFMLQCMSAIGLISQIYHIGGEFYETMMLWSLITAALMGVSRSVFVVGLWSIGFFIGLSGTWSESGAIRVFMDGEGFAAYMSFFAAWPLLCILLAGCSQYLGGASSSHARVFRVLAMLAGVFAWGNFENAGMRYSDVVGSSTVFPYYILPACVLAIPVAIGIARGALHTIHKRLLWAILLSYLVAYGVVYKITDDAYIELLPAVLTIWVLALAALLVAVLKRRRWFGVFLTLIGMRFVVLYFEAFGGLATTGLGLIIAGILIVVTGLLLSRNHTRIAQWAEGLT